MPTRLQQLPMHKITTPNWFPCAAPPLIQAQVTQAAHSPLDLTIDFLVPQWQHTDQAVSARFKSDHCHNWGLWEHDVVEAFWQLRQTPDDLAAPYLELQISPLGQRFGLIIVTPRKQYFSPLHLDFSGYSRCGPLGWQAQIQIDLALWQDRYLGPGHLLYGQLAASLGGRYSSTQSPWPTRPDFHQPGLFLNFGSCDL